MSVDHSELSRLARDLGLLTSPQVRQDVEKAVEWSARDVKDRWNNKLYREGHAKLTGRSITYDVGVAHDLGLGTSYLDALEAGSGAATIIAEIGPKRGSGKQAGVVLLLENGSVNNQPHGYGAGALHEAEARFEYGIDLALGKIEKEAGL